MNRETGLIDAETYTGEQTKRQLGVMHAACASASCARPHIYAFRVRSFDVNMPKG